MSVSESCGCGGSFSADRPKDELRLLNSWRLAHKCFVGGDLAVTGGSGLVDLAPDFTDKNLHIGFRGQEFDDD